jgi:hypothetical protein
MLNGVGLSFQNTVLVVRSSIAFRPHFGLALPVGKKKYAYPVSGEPSAMTQSTHADRAANLQGRV